MRHDTMILRQVFLCSSVVIFLFLAGGSSSQAESVSSSQDSPTPTGCLADKSLTDYQNELLALAFNTASVIPNSPHIKDRSREQEAVIEVALKLDQPKRALKYIEEIKNWRRGAGYADLAFYCAQNSRTDGIQAYLDKAENISTSAEEWRRDTIKIKIAKTHALMGQTQKTDQFEKGVVDSEMGKVVGAEAMVTDKDSFDEQIKELDEFFATENFDIMKNTLESSTEIFNRFYDDKKRRTLVEKKIKTSWKKMPIFIRIERLMDMAKVALNHWDKGKALKLVKEAHKMFDGATWPVEHHISMAAKLAGLRFLAGDEKRARTDADAMRALFDKERDQIVNIDRAEALIPLAEAYQTMGNSPTALAVYKLAVDEGALNPNARPRAEDLSATARSMALKGVEPDAELWARMRQIKEGLADPW